jgi:rubredoxin
MICNTYKKFMKRVYYKGPILFALVVRRRGWSMDKYECTICGWVYDPEVGDPVGGIAAGVAFEDLPDDWVCPQCGAEKDMFQKI